MPARLSGGVAVAAGLVLLALCLPLAGRRPIYDGVIVTEPYLYLHPGPGQHGDPTSDSEVFDIVGGQSPILSAGTGEMPPQASVYGNQGDLLVGAGTTWIRIDIQPIEPPAQPRQGSIAGNAYEIDASDQSGATVYPAPGGGFSVVLRQPEDVSGKATMALFAYGEWREVPSSDAGSRGFYVATPPELGVFALMVGAGRLSTLPPFAPPTAATTTAELPTMSEFATVETAGPSAAQTALAAATTVVIPSSAPAPPPPANATSSGVAVLLIVIAIAALIAAIALPRLMRRR